ncbi:MAG: DNA-3-methyladenine glycosylase 2 family protein [Planctomycetota bacterium]|nr:DNA-3-methyladenine glycosylase 2 family protein [Planctomycetota bacterium]
MAQRIWRPHKAVRALCARDARFTALFEAIGKPAVPLRDSTFGAIARAIAYQQLAGAAASAIWGRVLALFPAEVELDPRAVLRKRDETFRKAGLSGAKTRSIKDLARHIVDGAFDPADFPGQDDDEVIEALTQVWGIGVWSAQMHLMFSLGRLDVWPVLDLGVRNGWAKFTGGPAPTARELEPLGEPFRPYRSVVAWSMWRVLDVSERPIA